MAKQYDHKANHKQAQLRVDKNVQGGKKTSNYKAAASGLFMPTLKLPPNTVFIMCKRGRVVSTDYAVIIFVLITTAVLFIDFEFVDIIGFCVCKCCYFLFRLHLYIYCILRQCASKLCEVH